MSYDLRLKVKIEGLDKFAIIAEPEYSSPTYNLGTMFRKAMNWDFEQSVNYKCSEIINNIIQGIDNLKEKEEEYKQYEPENRWGSVNGARLVLISLKNCIYEQDIPLDYLYMSW